MSLPQWLDDPALTRVWMSLHDKLERYGPTWRGTVTIDHLTAGEQRALSTLLGRPVLRASCRLALADLDDRLLAAGGLATVVEAVVGRTVTDRRSVRALAAAARLAAVDAAAAVLPPAGWVAGWLEDVRRSGIPAAESAAAAGVLAALLGERRVSRVDLAAEVLGDAHGLDDDARLSGLVLRGLARRFDVATPVDAAGRRELWALAGVSGDEVSVTCLVRALPVRTGPLAERLRSGDPVHLTRRDLRRYDVTLPAGQAVLIVENPRVLEAIADAELDIAVVCGNGSPHTVTMDLLQTLAGAGCMLSYHGDFDWAGLAIANRLVRSVGVTPWAMSADDYLAAPRGLPLQGTPVDAIWSPALTAAMSRRGVAVHEEAMLPALLERLARDE